MSLPEGTLSGRFGPIENVEDGTCVVMQEFGSQPELTPNHEIVDYVYGNERLANLPKFVSGSIAKILEQRKYDMTDVHVFEGESATNTAENTGTDGELGQFQDYAAEHPEVDCSRPIFVSSGYNIGNIVRQAQLHKIGGLIVPPDLPHSFDWHSKQLWTKHWALWAVTSHIRIRKLERKGH